MHSRQNRSRRRREGGKDWIWAGGWETEWFDLFSRDYWKRRIST
jgi:hypothetical protein